MDRVRRVLPGGRAAAIHAPGRPAGPAPRRDRAARWEKPEEQPAQYASLTASITGNIIIGLVQLDFVEQIAGQRLLQAFPELDGKHFGGRDAALQDRKSTRLNSSHSQIS